FSKYCSPIRRRRRPIPRCGRWPSCRSSTCASDPRRRRSSRFPRPASGRACRSVSFARCLPRRPDSGCVFTTLHFVALACYGLTVGVVVIPLLRLGEVQKSAVAIPLSLTGAAVAVHFIALLAYARAFGSLPLAGFAPALSSLAFLLGLLTLAVEWVTRESAIAAVVGPLVVVVMVVALASGFGPAPSAPVRDGSWFVLHVAASLLGLALMAVAFAAAALYLLQHRELKQ